MLLLVLALLASFIPSLILYIYFRRFHREDKAYGKRCGKMLGKGFLSALMVALFALVLDIAGNMLGIKKLSPLLQAAFRAFILAAFVEEFVKYLTAKSMLKKEPGCISRLDLIALTGIAGMGFHIVESVVYFFSTNLIQILVRGVTASHTTFGMLMGYFTGKAIAEDKPSYKVIGILIPLLLHGLYDFSLADEFGALNDNLVFVPFIVIFLQLVILVWILRKIRNSRNLPEYNRPIN